MKKSVKVLCALSGFSGLMISASGFASKTKIEKPNIIFIYADDLGFGDLQCYGTGNVDTPNVNKLAQEGLRFTNCHTTSSVSTPSRFGLLTGVYPWRQKGTGIAAGNAGMIIHPDRYTLADVAHSAGYKTAAIGKWHLGIGETARQNWNGLISPNLSDIGFNYSYIMAATGDRVPCVFVENAKVANYDSSAPISVSYKKNFEGEPTGKSNPELLRLMYSHGHDQSIVNGVSRIGYMKGGGKALWRDEDIADTLTNQAIDFIRNNKNNHFMLYFCTQDVHVPRLPNERFQGKSGHGSRGDAILEFDYTVGKIMNELKTLGIDENTLVILTSDNGPVLDDGYKDEAVEKLCKHNPFGPYSGGKYSAFEAGTRVPMIVRWPSHVKKGAVSNALFSQIDYLASINQLIGGKIENGAASDSKPNLKIILGKDLIGRNYIIEQNVNNTLSVFYKKWKYIMPSKASAYNKNVNIALGNNPKPQLYNLHKDVEEKNNVYDKKANIVKKIKIIIEDELNKDTTL